MKCPYCSRFLKSVDVGPFEIDKCDNCNAIWFDPSEFEKYYEVAFSISDFFRFKEKSNNCPCPKCQNVDLNLGHISNMEVYLCGSCEGIFVKEDQVKKYKNSSSSIWDYYTQIDPFIVIENLLGMLD
ncbi:TFIIB-type zinc ribbon-containing protein [Desulforhopalus sp. 52FAK]